MFHSYRNAGIAPHCQFVQLLGFTYNVQPNLQRSTPSEPPSNAGATGAFGEDCLSPRRFFRAGEFRSRLSLRVTQGIPEGRFSGAAFFGHPFLAAQERVVAAGLPPAYSSLQIERRPHLQHCSKEDYTEHWDTTNVFHSYRNAGIAPPCQFVQLLGFT